MYPARSLTPEPHATTDHAPEALERRRIEKDRYLGSLEASLQGPRVVPIHDPCFALTQFRDLTIPSFVSRLLPPGSPEMAIEMDER